MAQPGNDPEERPKGSSLQPLKALWPFIEPYRGTLILAIIALLVAAGALLALPLAVRSVIDQGFEGDNPSNINQYFIALFLITCLFGLVGAIRLYLVTWLGERVVADIRDKVYQRVIRLDPAFFEITKTGEVLSRLTTDTTLIQSIAGVGISIALRGVITLIGALVMLAITSPKLTGYIIVLVPVVIIPILVIGRRVRRLSRDSQDKVADSSGMAGETLNAVQTIQAFTLEKFQSDRFSRYVEEAFATAAHRIRVRSAMTGLTIVALFGTIILVLWIGAQSVIAGEITAGELSQFVLYTMFVASSGASLSEMWGEVQRAAGAMERLLELLGATPTIKVPENPLPLPHQRLGSVVFENVGFSYPSRPDQPAINDFSIAIKPGETVAFVGPSGAGKSTTFHLLLRFYDPKSGLLKIDGVDIAEADPVEVRGRIGVVPQETVIFGTSAMQNIRYGRPEATDEEVVAAAKAAAAHEFIEQMPEGYDTFLGERGMRLSGGQRQRLAIARAMLKNPPILLLDEATSALDAESEQLVQKALERLMENRTTIIIAHRLATVLKAYRIVVMDKGEFVDSGTHSELVASNPLYARLAELQFNNPDEQEARKS
ncbi:MAG: ABC transporter transmembrane domain-containing protein [Gammaproteobacteria bacterium]|nr:ABC transporter transmembrane domain-containing protein [Gammaproteobacteria bacterium]